MKNVNELIMHTPDPDCCFQTQDNKRFRLRAAGLIIEDGMALFLTNKNKSYYYPFGGCIQLGESAEQAALREILEETGTRYEIDRLVFVHENFFKRDDVDFKDLECHEITFYFLMKSRGTQELKSDSSEQNVTENPAWLPIDKLYKYNMYPKFLIEKMKNLPIHVEHFVSK